MSTLARPRILHCAETIKGGIATYLRDLIPLQCAAFGASNIVVVIPEGQVGEMPLPEGVKLVTYRDGSSRVLNGVRLALCVAVQSRRERISILHVHSTFAGAAVRPLMALAHRSARVVYCAHGWAWDRTLSAKARSAITAVERGLARFCDVIVCISEHERRTAIEAGIQMSRLVVVCNGVGNSPPEAVGKEPDWPDGRTRILFVGRFDRQKGVDVLLEAARQLHDLVYVVIAGAPVLGDESELSVPNNVKLVGWVSPEQREALFKSADLLVVPSRWEGFGLIAAEAMRASLAVLATRVGGLPEVVLDGVTGVVVEPDSPEALMVPLMQMTRADWRRMGRAGHERFSNHFTMGRVHRELCAVYGLAD